MTPTIDPPTTLYVRPVVGRADREAAQRLIVEYFDWLASAIGCDPEVLQAEIAVERSDAAGYYHGLDAAGASGTAAGNSGRGVLLLARLDGRAAGLVAVRWLTAGRAEMKRLYVRPDARGAGVGDALVDSAIAVATANGCRRLVLETLAPQMPVALRMYERRGFVPIPVFSLDEPSDGIVALSLSLPATRK